MDFYPIKLDPAGPAWFIWLVALLGLALNLGLNMLLAFLLAYAAAKGWAAAA